MNSDAVDASVPSAADEPALKVLLCVQPLAVCCCRLLGIVLSSMVAECNSYITHTMGFNSIAAEVGNAIGVMHASKAAGRSIVGSPCAKGLLI